MADKKRGYRDTLPGVHKYSTVYRNLLGDWIVNHTSDYELVLRTLELCKQNDFRTYLLYDNEHQQILDYSAHQHSKELMLNIVLEDKVKPMPKQVVLPDWLVVFYQDGSWNISEFTNRENTVVYLKTLDANGIEDWLAYETKTDRIRDFKPTFHSKEYMLSVLKELAYKRYEVQVNKADVPEPPQKQYIIDAGGYLDGPYNQKELEVKIEDGEIKNKTTIYEVSKMHKLLITYTFQEIKAE